MGSEITGSCTSFPKIDQFVYLSVSVLVLGGGQLLSNNRLSVHNSVLALTVYTYMCRICDSQLYSYSEMAVHVTKRRNRTSILQTVWHHHSSTGCSQMKIKTPMSLASFYSHTTAQLHLKMLSKTVLGEKQEERELKCYMQLQAFIPLLVFDCLQFVHGRTCHCLLFPSKSSAQCFVACASFLYQRWLKGLRHTVYLTYQLVNSICADEVTSDPMHSLSHWITNIQMACSYMVCVCSMTYRYLQNQNQVINFLLSPFKQISKLSKGRQCNMNALSSTVAHNLAGLLYMLLFSVVTLCTVLAFTMAFTMETLK